MASDSMQTLGVEDAQPEHLLEVLIRYFHSQSRLAADVLTGRRESSLDYITWLEGIQAARRLLAANPRTPSDLLKMFSKAEDVETLKALVRNPATPQGLVDQVVSNASFELKYTLAGSSGIPLPVRRALANDPDDEVRWILAENAWVGDEILEVLARGSDETGAVTYNLLRNPNVPRAALTQIEDSEPDGPMKKIASLLLEIDDLRTQISEEEENDL